MDDAGKQMIDGLKNRQLFAYEELFFRYHGRLVLFARKFTGDLQVAQDIVQDAFLTLWEKAEELHIYNSPKSYLFQAVRNSCLNHTRHLTVRQSAEDELISKIQSAEKSTCLAFEDPFFSLLELEMEQKLEKVVDSMPEKCQQVFKLSRHEHLKNREIAAKLGISVKMVEKQISKALRILRSELAEYLASLLFIFLDHF